MAALYSFMLWDFSLPLTESVMQSVMCLDVIIQIKIAKWGPDKVRRRKHGKTPTQTCFIKKTRHHTDINQIA